MTCDDLRFLTVDVALAVHDRHLAEHGGFAGIKDIDLFEPALARPINSMATQKPTPARWR